MSHLHYDWADRIEDRTAENPETICRRLPSRLEQPSRESAHVGAGQEAVDARAI